MSGLWPRLRAGWAHLEDKLREEDKQQHMLSEKKNGDMLKPSSTPQPNVPLKTIGP